MRTAICRTSVVREKTTNVTQHTTSRSRTQITASLWFRPHGFVISSFGMLANLTHNPRQRLTSINLDRFPKSKFLFLSYKQILENSRCLYAGCFSLSFYWHFAIVDVMFWSCSTIFSETVWTEWFVSAYRMDSPQFPQTSGTSCCICIGLGINATHAPVWWGF